MKSGRLLAHRILQQIGSERSDSIREMHFWTFSVFLCFQTSGMYVDFGRLLADPIMHAAVVYKKNRCFIFQAF